MLHNSCDFRNVLLYSFFYFLSNTLDFKTQTFLISKNFAQHFVKFLLIFKKDQLCKKQCYNACKSSFIVHDQFDIWWKLVIFKIKYHIHIYKIVAMKGLICVIIYIKSPTKFLLSKLFTVTYMYHRFCSLITHPNPIPQQKRHT